MNIKVAVICAVPRLNNPGMVSVDLAATDLVRDVFGKAGKVQRFCATPLSDLDVNPLRDDYEFLHDPKSQLANFDHIIIWGDFQQCFVHIQDLIQLSCERIPGMTREKAESHYYKCLLLEGLDDDIAARTFSFGTTIHPNASNLGTTRYRVAFESYLRRCRFVCFRDGASASLAILQGAPLSKINVGPDCAFFLDETRLGCTQPPADEDKEESILGFSFGRSKSLRRFPLRARIQIGRLLRHTCRVRAYQNTLDLRWFDAANAGRDISDTIKEVHRCRMIVTDIYHLSITAIRSGIPAILVGDATARMTNSLNDKKKEMLYQGLAMENMYVYGEEFLRSTNLSFLSRLLNEIDEAKFRADILQKLDHAKSAAVNLVQQSVSRGSRGAA